MIETKRTNRESRVPTPGKITTAAALFLAACTISLSGCSAQGTTEETTKTPAAENGWESTGTDDNAAEVNVESSSEETTVEEESTIPAELDDGETILGRESGTESAFKGPGLLDGNAAASWDDGELYLLQAADAESGAELLSVPVYSNDAAADQKAYLDSGNDEGLTDPNTVIHGSAAAGGPLEKLTEYGDAQYSEQNPYLYLTTTDGSVMEYQLIAAYTADHTDILTGTNFYDADEYAAYIDSIYSQRNMQAVLNADLQQDAVNIWCLLTIQGSVSDTQDFIVQAIPTGVEYQ